MLKAYGILMRAWLTELHIVHCQQGLGQIFHNMECSCFPLAINWAINYLHIHIIIWLLVSLCPWGSNWELASIAQILAFCLFGAKPLSGATATWFVDPCRRYETSMGWLINTLKQRQMAAVSYTTLSNAFSWMKMSEFRLRFHRSLFLRVELTIIQHWFR